MIIDVFPQGGNWTAFDRHAELQKMIWAHLKEGVPDSGGVWRYMNFTSSDSLWDFELDGKVVASLSIEYDENERIEKLSIQSKFDSLENVPTLRLLLAEALKQFGCKAIPKQA